MSWFIEAIPQENGFANYDFVRKLPQPAICRLKSIAISAMVGSLFYLKNIRSGTKLLLRSICIQGLVDSNRAVILCFNPLLMDYSFWFYTINLV